MENERRKKLEETMKGFNKKHKSDVFQFGNTVEESKNIMTGIKEIDSFIGGGFKKGAHTIIYGQYSVGKTALVLTTIAQAQKEGLVVMYINTEKPIDRERFEFFGINLDDLIYIEAPENAELALEAIRTVCKDKLVDMIVIDSTNGLSPKSTQEDSKGKERALEKKDVAALALTLSNFYNKVNALVFKSRTAVVWIGQTRTQGIGSFFVHQGLSGGNAQEFYAYQIIYMRRAQKSNNPTAKVRSYFWDSEKNKLRYTTENEDIGFSVVMKLEKTNASKSAKQGKEAEVPYFDESGFVIPAEKEMEIRIKAEDDEQKELIQQMLIEEGIIESEKNGSVESCVDEVVEEEITEPCEAKEEKPKKKGRGRPKKKDK